MNRETQLAIDKLKKENIQRDAMEYGVFELAAAWAECDAEAYKYILKNNKKIKGALSFMRKAAKKKAVNNTACVDMPESMALIMEYYGMKADDAKAKLEDGLMYAIFSRIMEGWQSYQGLNPTPGADLAQTAAPERRKEAPGSSMFGVLPSLEDLL